jgi:two-component system chemotaxis sensor kinase CheA
VRSVAGARVLVLDDGVLPLLDDTGTTDPDFAVIVRGREQRLALGVERLIGQQELVTRPLPEDVAATGTFSGGAVLSNGDIALIVDCDALGALERSLAA